MAWRSMVSEWLLSRILPLSLMMRCGFSSGHTPRLPGRSRIQRYSRVSCSPAVNCSPSTLTAVRTRSCNHKGDYLAEQDNQVPDPLHRLLEVGQASDRVMGLLVEIHIGAPCVEQIA